MELMTTAAGWGLGKARDAALTAVKSVWKKAAAERELKAIRSRACEQAIAAAPAFAEDLRSKSFGEGVLAPIVRDMLTNPGRPWEPRLLARAYLDRFVGADAEMHNDVLSRIYRIEPSTVTDAFEALLDAFRQELQRSKYWKEAVRDAILTDLRGDVKAILTFTRPPQASDVSVALARDDAKAGSEALRSWKRDIEGEEIERPELQQLLDRIKAHPRGKTLLIGEAGAGKSALLAKLTATLEGQGVPVFALKADLLSPDLTCAADLTGALKLKGPIEAEIEVLARTGPMVLLIDQLDAVSDVMDRTSQRMRVLLALAEQALGPEGEFSRRVHVVVSSRPFEAAHDARFKSLRAEEISLSLPALAAVNAMLAKLCIDTASLSPEFLQALRRPFALRLFIELHRRGPVPAGLAGTSLLDAWLASAKLGEGAARSAALAFLRRLASDMTETETLWRPADLYDLDDREAVALCMAAGLLDKRAGKIGFSHQAWLDDFQAKALSSADKLTAYVWERQDGMFSRATALRALQRLRAFDEEEYLLAIDALLGDAKTRRHIRHLIVDHVATQQEPKDREAAWVRRLIGEDPALGRRAIGHVIRAWDGWRGAIVSRIPWMMGQAEYRWSAGALLRAEAAFDPTGVEALVLAHWPAPAQDAEAFEVLYRAGLWSSAVQARLAGIFAKAHDHGYALAEYAKNLAQAGRLDAAAELIHLYIRSAPAKQVADLDFKDFEGIVGEADEAVARALTPWLLSLSPDPDYVGSAYVDSYPTLPGLAITWGLNSDGASGVYRMLRTSLAKLAASAPDKALELLRPAYAVELDEVQALVALTLAAAAPALVEESLAFLLADRRRLRIGTAYREDIEGVGHTVYGAASHALVAAIGPHLSNVQAEQLRDAITTWDHYKNAAWEDASGDTYRSRLRWAEEARFPLLASLPPAVVPARKRRQIAEWLKQQPVFVPGERGMTLSAVGSPMATEQMLKASDDEILGMLSAVDDKVDGLTARRTRGRRRWPHAGGVGQLAQAFSAFAVERPDRALALLSRLDPLRQTYVAGDAIRSLAAKSAVDPRTLLDCIHALIAKGFDGPGWRRDIAWAFEELASRLEGLADEDIERLEGWMTPYTPPASASGGEASTRRGKPEDRIGPAVFGRGGGLTLVPQGNLNMLRAIYLGLMRRPQPDHAGWLAVLWRHLDMPDKPETWSHLLASRGASLFNVDRQDAKAFVQALWDRYPDALEPLDVVYFTWTCRALMPTQVAEGLLVRWLGSSDRLRRQAAGEVSTVLRLLGEASELVTMAACALEEAERGPGRLGVLFGAAVAWREGEGALRAKAHDILRRAARGAKGDEAIAIAAVIEGRGALQPDAMTRELLGWLATENDLLVAFLRTRFLDALQGLLLAPGFEDSVLKIVERSVELLVGSGARGGAFVSRELVSVAIALQRSGGDRRVRAMNAYEALLDIDAYGADAAAAASLRT